MSALKFLVYLTFTFVTLPTYSLACLGSCSDLKLIVLEDAETQRCIPPSFDSVNGNENMRPAQRMAHSSLNLYHSEMSESFSQSSLQRHIPTDRIQTVESHANDGQSRNTNSIHCWSRRRSGSLGIPFNGTSSTSSDEITDFVIRQQTCGSNNRYPLISTPSRSIPDNILADSLTCRSPLMFNGFPKAHTPNSCDRAILTESGINRSFGSLGTAGRHEPNTRLIECGYQVHSDIDEDTDDEVVLRKRRGRRAPICQDEKLSILELLHEDGRFHRCQATPELVSPSDVVVQCQYAVCCCAHQLLNTVEFVLLTMHQISIPHFLQRHLCLFWFQQ